MIAVAELLHGADADVVVNCYLAVLGRWPDEAGFAHHLASIREQPERRLAMLERMAGSEEARLAGRGMPRGAPGEASPEAALAAQLRLRTAFLLDEIGKLRGASATPALPPGFAEEVAALQSDFEALRREVRARLALLEQARAAALPEEARAPGGLAEYLLDLVEISEARTLARLRSLERRAFGGDTEG